MPLIPSALLGARHERLRHSFAELAIEALVVSYPSNLRYLTNHAGTAGLAVMTARAVVLLVDFRYQTAVEMLQASPAACPGLDVRQVPGSYDAALVECLESLGVRTRRVRGRARQRGPPRSVGARVPRTRAGARLRCHRSGGGTAAANQG